ncbi:MAG: Ig-like domain-containing protein [Candidatus Marinimicrobia bacterium]|nr:Ig-like domain-containing protein [Candidatus Neomarinimicrobiota bacterium]
MIKKITALGIIVLFTLLFIYCTTDESAIIGPFGNADKYLSVVSLSADKTTLYSNGDTSTISIKLIDVDNSPVIGLKVDFTTEFGSITESDITDSSGIAIATFISDENTGKNIITVDTGIKKYTLTIEVVNYQPKYIELFSESTGLLADGKSSTIITAVLKDSVGNPMPDVTVNFTTTLGTLIPQVALTNSDGVATTVLTSESVEGVATITATSGIVKSIDIKFYGPAYIELSAGSLLLLADGISSTVITAVLKDSVGNSVPEITVNFETDLGTLNSHIEITDDTGKATTILTSATEEGVATITATSFATSYIEVEFKYSVPVYIVIEVIDPEIPTLLADGISKANIIAKVYDSANKVIPGVVFDFSTTVGSLNPTTDVRANQEGLAEVTFTSAGSSIDTTAIVKVVVAADTSVSKDINIQLRGITSVTYIDSANMSDDGIYKAYIRTNLLETTNADYITSNVGVLFSSPGGVGWMDQPLVEVIDQGTALSVFNAEVLPTTQNDIFITSELVSASEVSSESEDFDIPGAEILINTIGDYIMGDGEGWALVKATLRESDGNKAIPLNGISWSTTLGTIKGQSRTNTMGQTIDTLRIEKNTVSDTTNATITANFGDYVLTNEILTFIPPVNNNRLILGFEANISSDDSNFVACDIDDEFAVRDFGISALFVDENARGLNWELIYFSVVPNNLARICDRAYTKNNGIATVMLAYPPQNGGEIIRVWAAYDDGTRGSIDIILPVVGEEDDEGGG